MFPAVFLDRDGVLIENRSDYVQDWSQVTILPETITALSSFHDAGFKIVIVTNQSAVGRGIITFDTVQEINDRLIKIIEKNGGRIDAVYVCPHKPEDYCNCRKPQPGLLFQAARDLSLDLSSSWMIGDAWSDLLAGQAAGLRELIMVKTGRGSEQLLQAQPKELRTFRVHDTISEAISAIIASRKF